MRKDQFQIKALQNYKHLTGRDLTMYHEVRSNGFRKLHFDYNPLAAKEELDAILRNGYSTTNDLLALWKCLHPPKVKDFIISWLGFKEEDIKEAHIDLMKVLESGPDRLLVMMPRGSYKSTIVTTAFGLMNLVFRHPLLDPRPFALGVTSYKKDLPKKFILAMKDIIESGARHEIVDGKEIYKPSFGESYPWAVWPKFSNAPIWGVNKLQLLNGSTVEPCSIPKLSTGYHFDMEISDDMIEESNKDDREAQLVIEEKDRLIENSILNKPGGVRIVVGTRWYRGDIHSKKEADKDYTQFVFDIEDDDGNSKWPEKYSNEFLAKMKSENPVFYCGQYRMKIPEEFSNAFSPNHVVFVEEVPRGGLTLVLIDPAHSRENKKKNCNTAIAVVRTICYETQNGLVFNNYIVDGDFGKGWDEFSPSKTSNKALDFADRYGANYIGVEDVGAQAFLLDTLLNAAKQREKTYVFRAIKGHNSSASKVSRILKTQPDFFGGRTFICNNRFGHQFASEVLTFPYGLIDCLDTYSFAYDFPEWRDKHVAREDKSDIKKVLAQRKKKRLGIFI